MLLERNIIHMDDANWTVVSDMWNNSVACGGCKPLMRGHSQANEHSHACIDMLPLKCDSPLLQAPHAANLHCVEEGGGPQIQPCAHPRKFRHAHLHIWLVLKIVTYQSQVSVRMTVTFGGLDFKLKGYEPNKLYAEMGSIRDSPAYLQILQACMSETLSTSGSALSFI